MKLRNKKTGEIKELQEVIHQAYQEHNIVSLNKLNEEWEDYEEPKDENLQLKRDLAELKDMIKAYEHLLRTKGYIKGGQI